MDDRTVARWRLHSLRLCGAPYASPADVVGGLLAVQAENYAQAAWAVACRTERCTESDLDALFDEGVILRTHVLRSTWHFVLPEDIGWLVALTAPRVARLYAQLQHQLEIQNATLDAAVSAVVEVLDGGRHLTRHALGTELGQRGLPAEGQGLGLVMATAELRGLVCSGRRQGTRQTYALLADRAPAARRLDDEDEALGELAWRYFSGHGPATERDLAYWATLTLTEVRRGLAAASHLLDHIDHDGRRYWFAEPAPDGRGFEPRGHLLQILDEYHHGYQDSRYVLDADGLVPRGRSASMGMTLVDGQMVGDMRRTVRSGAVTYDVSLSRRLADDEEAAVRQAADRYGRFLGLEPSLVTARPVGPEQ